MFVVNVVIKLKIKNIITFAGTTTLITPKEGNLLEKFYNQLFLD